MSKEESKKSVDDEKIVIDSKKFNGKFTMDKWVTLNNSGGLLQDMLSSISEDAEAFQNDFFTPDEKVIKVDFTKQK